MKKFLLLTMMALSLIVSNHAMAEVLTDEDLQSLLESVAIISNTDTPKAVSHDVDELYTAVEYKKLAFKYIVKSINKDKIPMSIIQKELEKRFKAQANMQDFCNQQLAKAILKSNAKVEYRYLDANNRFLTSFIITRKNCNY